MHAGRLSHALAMLALTLVTIACVGQGSVSPTSTPHPTKTSTPEAFSVAGPDCPQGFDEEQDLQDTLKIQVNDAFTLTVGSNPSMPCGWASPEIGDDAVLRQVDHHSI